MRYCKSSQLFFLKALLQCTIRALPPLLSIRAVKAQKSVACTIYCHLSFICAIFFYLTFSFFLFLSKKDRATLVLNNFAQRWLVRISPASRLWFTSTRCWSFLLVRKDRISYGSIVTKKSTKIFSSFFWKFGDKLLIDILHRTCRSPSITYFLINSIVLLKWNSIYSQTFLIVNKFSQSHHTFPFPHTLVCAWWLKGLLHFSRFKNASTCKVIVDSANVLW